MHENVIVFPKNLTAYKLNYDILEQIHRKLTDGVSNITFDFTNVEFVVPATIPNLLNIGQIWRNHFNYPINLELSYNPHLSEILYFSDFFEYCDQFDLYNYNPDFVGGFDAVANPYPFQTLFFPSDVPYEDADDLFEYVYRSIKKYDEVLKKFSDINRGAHSDLLTMITELCVNAVFHGQSHVFFNTSIIGSGHFPKAYVAISDTGCGYRSTFMKKDREDMLFFSHEDICSDDHLSNARAIIASIFFRKNNAKYGIYEVLQAIIKKDGKLRIHSDNTQLVFSAENSKRIFEKADNPVEFFDQFVLENQHNHSCVRITDYRMTGVHIEMEVPLR